MMSTRPPPLESTHPLPVLHMLAHPPPALHVNTPTSSPSRINTPTTSPARVDTPTIFTSPSRVYTPITDSLDVITDPTDDPLQDFLMIASFISKSPFIYLVLLAGTQDATGSSPPPIGTNMYHYDYNTVIVITFTHTQSH